jgi:hypothetical protein
MINELKPHHKDVYIALVRDMEKKKNGLFSFIMRMEGGYIVDYVVMENIAPHDKIEIDESQPAPVSLKN